MTLSPLKQKAWNEHKQTVRQERAQARSMRTAASKGHVHGRAERRALRFARTPTTEMPANIAHYTQRKVTATQRTARAKHLAESANPIKRYRRGRGTHIAHQAATN